MIFQQLFESSSSTYTYLLGCPITKTAVLIDPVLETVERDISILNALGLTLRYTLETHIHADHLSGGYQLRQRTGCLIALPAIEQLPCADIGIEEGTPLCVGEVQIHPLYTPGHTSSHHAYYVDTGTHLMLFSGDALLIDACGRTDFQAGNAGQLYDSIQHKLFTLPNETLVYPGHDYEGRFISSIAQEKQRNPRLSNNKSKQAFIELMNGLKTPNPRKMAFAVPSNKQCGMCPPNIFEEYQQLCETLV
ncbi:MBL fold metallo-hydrolase [Beggiatoa leptomitoformis]|uniref:MBL fold metallo-hydrolase n=1 Tax=Beggiatoa leptomitoformis TaxID=288004 RepID=A0A2N9YEY8_9GAMM|nr:MBL fold metallo-hydrolase [Beggiatoa leptomitoformis]ALG68607.1 MBL fold metallo-hydrolase [Beggiatoa leptomitoformis]AUI69048.1 MBL fold metallo-hydrolase [Beggiatoa leptomitoformis]